MKKLLLSIIATVSFASLSNAQVLYTESFEGASFPPSGWGIFNNGTGNSWALNDFEPAFASDGVQSMYYEYSATDAADAWAFSPDINFVTGDSIVIMFDYIVASQDYPESLKLTIGNGQSVGAQTTVLWDQASLVNETYQTATVGVKILANGTYNFGFNCYSLADMYYLGVDYIRIRKVLSNDLKLNAYTGTTRSCNFIPGEELSIDVSNIGGGAQTNFPIAYQINNNPVVSETYTASIAAGATDNFIFLTGADFSTPGTYQVKIFSQLASDGDRTNDTTWFTVISEPSGLMMKTSMDTAFIPDNDPEGIISEIPFCGIANNLGTNIRINQLMINGITHTWDDDIDITLFSPSGDSLVITADIGGDNDDYPNLIFADTALTNIIVFDEDIILPGYYHTQDSIGFAKFNGQNPNGMWKLKITDDAGADTGYLISWTLEFDNAVGIAKHNAVNELINMYPNPNNGLFTIESGSDLPLAITIYSINGQEVEHIAMSSKGKQMIDLRDLAKGMYFVKAVSDKGIQTTKVIIE